MVLEKWKRSYMYVYVYIHMYLYICKLGFRVLGQGSSTSRLIMVITRVALWALGVINLLPKSQTQP